MKLNKADSKSGSLGSLSKQTCTPDQFFKMSKKIAQLTKVIAYLHSKQEDHDTVLTSTKEAYEHEIFLVIKDAKQRIHVLNDSNQAIRNESALALQVF